MAVTNNIREIREQRGIYQDDLAAAIGYSTKTVGRIERGDSTPSAEFMLRISKYFNMLVEDVFHVEDWAGYFIQLNLPLPVNENLSAPLYKIIPFFRTTNYFSSAHKIKRSEHSVGCDTLHVFFINPLVKIWSIGDAGVVNLVLIGEINARMILYNFCELVTSHAVVKTSKNNQTRL